MTALCLEFGLAGLVLLLLASAFWIKAGARRPMPVRVSGRSVIGAAHPDR